MFPSYRFSRAGGKQLVNSAEEAQQLGEEWADSPVAFGIETHPAATGPDPEIAKNKLPEPPAAESEPEPKPEPKAKREPKPKPEKAK